MKTTTALAAALIAALMLGGCSESGDVTLAEPGVYKGPRDPLLKGQGAERTETLQKRLRMIQTDR